MSGHKKYGVLRQQLEERLADDPEALQRLETRRQAVRDAIVDPMNVPDGASLQELDDVAGSRADLQALVETIAARSNLTDDEAMQLAYEELHAMRSERHLDE